MDKILLSFLKGLALCLAVFSVGHFRAQLFEDFESGLPTAYTTVTEYHLNSGKWTGSADYVVREVQGRVSGSYSCQLKNATDAQITTPAIVGGVEEVSFYASSMAASNGIRVQMSTDGIAFSDVGNSFTTLTAEPKRYSVSVKSNASTVYIRFRRTAGTIRLDDVLITPLDRRPTLQMNPANIDSLDYQFDKGPFEIKSFTLKGFFLEGNVELAAPGNFEISQNANGVFGNALTLVPDADGMINGSIHTRLKAGLTVADYSGAIQVASGTATGSVTLKGSVYPVSAYCFSDTFDTANTGDNRTTAGSGTAWPGDAMFVTVQKVYKAGGAVKLGTSSDSGYITSVPLENIGGSVVVNLEVKGWTDVEGALKIMLGSQSKMVEYTSVMSGSFQKRSVSFSNVEPGATLTIATTAKRAYIDNVSVSCGTLNIWNGTSWSKGEPDAQSKAWLAKDYTGAYFISGEMFVAKGATLTITNTVTIHGKLVNNGSVIMEDGANLIQTVDGADSNTATGTFVLKKAGQSFAGRYAFWSVPVKTFNIYGMFAQAPQYVMAYVSTKDSYQVLANPATASPGIGYSVKIPADAATASFNGTPNNGRVAVSLNSTPNAAGNTYNLVGNPYPSALDLQSLYSNGENGIGATLYFWNNTGQKANAQWSNEPSTNWGIYNAETGTWARAHAALGTSVNQVAPGQGFIVVAKGPRMVFDNHMRGSNPAFSANRMAPSSHNAKLWLELLTPDKRTDATAITFGYGANNGLDAADSPLMGTAADNIFSLQEKNKLGIQGLEGFDDKMSVELGIKTAQTGLYTLSLKAAEGVLADRTKNIFIHDRLKGTYTNIRLQPFVFPGGAANDGRFALTFSSGAALAAAETKDSGIEFFRDGAQWTVEAANPILNVEIYDMSGRMVRTEQPKRTKYRVKPLPAGFYLINIETAGKTITKKFFF